MPPPPPPPPPAPGKRWISGLVSGAGKIISSVFGSSDGSDDSGSEFDEDDVATLISEQNQDDISHNQLNNFNQERVPDQLVEPNTILPSTSKSKITIAQLIAQETFTREESDKLIKLITSRVMEASRFIGEENDVFNRNQHLDYAPFSPVQVSPEMRSLAIAESKKWLEEKKRSAPSSSKTIDVGPCKPNTDNAQFEIESDIGSPIELAKSYMQAKPPWQSPFLTSSSTLFSTPPTGSSKFSSGFLQGSFDHSLPSSRLLKRDYFSTGFWDPKEESSRRVRSRLSESAFDSISSFARPGSSSRLYDKDIVESHKNLNFSLADGKEPSHGGLDLTLSQAGTVEATMKTSEPSLENNDLQYQEVAEKEQMIAKKTAVNLSQRAEGIVEVVNLETNDPILPAFSEKNDVVDRDLKIVTDEQPALEGNKDPKPHEGDLHITNSLHGSTNKNSANGPAVQSNMESEFESSINGGPTSSTAGPDVSDDKSLNGSNTHNDLKTQEPDITPIRKGRKRVVSGRGRGKGRVRGRGT